MPEKEFGTKSVLRNPNIAALFHRIEYIEQMGTGINRMQGQVKEYGLNPISFSFTSFVTANFWRTGQDKGQDKLNSSQIKIIENIKVKASITAAELSTIVGISERHINKNMKKLIDLKIIRRVGSKKTGYWEIVEKVI